MKRYATILLLAVAVAAILIAQGCRVSYGFTDANPLPDSIRTVRINFIENRAPYVNPQLSPTLTDRLKQKIVSQTKLTQTNSDNANWDISGVVTDYSVSTSGVSNNSTTGRPTPSVNRLTVTVQITRTDLRSNKEPQQFTVSRSFDFSANQTIQQAESQLLDEMVRNLTDEIFNQLFSGW